MVAPGDTPVNEGVPLRSSGGPLSPLCWPVYFGLAVVGEEAVDLLFYVGELGVAEALDGTATQQGVYRAS